MSVDFNNVSSLAIPECDVSMISSGDTVLWRKPVTNLADPTSPDWLIGYRLNGSGAPIAQEGKLITNYIGCTKGDAIYIKGASSFDASAASDRIVLYTANKTAHAVEYTLVFLTNAEDAVSGYLRKLGDGYYAFHATSPTTRYIRCCFTVPENVESVIITKNEEIN